MHFYSPKTESMKLLIVSLAAALLLLNCRKSRLTPDADLRTAVEKNPSSVLADNGESFHLLFDEYGQLLVHTAAGAVHYYKPGSDHFLTQLVKESKEKVIYRNAQWDVQNRVVKLEKYILDIPESTTEFTYNNDGYLSKRKLSIEGSGDVQEFIYTYSEGNLVEIKEYVNAALTSTMELSYDDNRFNTISIDLFDFKQIGFVTDGQFGKQSKNLVKSIKALNSGEPTGIHFYYNYKTDANGYLKSMAISANNETLKKYNFIFQ